MYIVFTSFLILIKVLGNYFQKLNSLDKDAFAKFSKICFGVSCAFAKTRVLLEKNMLFLEYLKIWHEL